MENNEEKSMAKQNAGVIIIIVGLLIAILGLGGYIVYDKYISDDEPEKVENKEEKEEEKETALNDNAVKEQLAKSITILEGAELYQDGGKSGYYFQGDVYAKNIKSEDIKDEDKLYALLKYSYRNDYNFTVDYNANDSGNTKIADGEKINQAYKFIFGENINNFKPKDGGCPGFEYNDSTKKYTGRSACGGTSQCWIDTYNNKYTVKGDNYYVYVNFGAYCAVENGGSKAFTNYEHNKAYDGEVTIDNNSHFITEENHDKFSEYKYTFTKTKDGDYKFVSVEKVK